ncbi:LacI family DNA-binding transcriptional regulator [Agromyces sp. NPDC049794]|uniref:LacI family DNA-binding transcriptional regulator n=1 Tax=unclassified Agromyces TaxID=2639701 RepID=UPI003410F2BA
MMTASRAKRPTISDVAAHARTSKGTVSFVLNGRAGVAPETRARILAAIDELGYQPSQIARSLSNSRAGAIGLVLARTPQTLRSDPFFAPFIAGVELAVSADDTSVLLRFVEDDAAERAAYERLASSRRVDGVILADLRRNDPRPALVSSLGLAAVTLNRPDVASPFPAVCNDDVTAIDAAAEHLVGLGHRRIAHVSGPLTYLHPNQRDASWRGALRRMGLDLAASVASDFTAEGGAQAMRALLETTSERRPTAIAFDNDTMAVAGIIAAQAAGLDVPGDVSIVGFDDAELSEYINPPLTTVRTDPFGWGEGAARTLLEVLDGDDVPDTVQAGVSTFVVRSSTGAAPA